MLRHIRLLVAFICATIYSVANALQPTVRAGSISMTNNTIKPASGNTILTTSTTKTTSNNTTRPSALSKFTPTTVVSAPSSGGGNVSSSVLAELQQQINDLRSAQLGLEQNQITRDDVENTVESQIKSLDLTTTNRDLKDTLSEIRSTTQGLSTSLTSIQQITDNYTESLNSDIDNRLKVRGILDANNEVTFAKKIDIEPDVLAHKIVTNTDATTTLVNSIQPKESEIRDIITNELTDVGVLKDGELDVEKKGQVVVSEETVTNALRNSQNFKNMVSEEITAKGYVTESALNEKNFINSDAIQNLATKDEITPTAIAAAIADDAVATATLSGKIGPDATEVNTIVTAKLKEKGILNPEENLQVATKDEIANLDSKFALKGEVGTDETAVKELISKDLYERGIVNEQGTLTIATDEKMAELSDTVETLNKTVNGDIDNPDSLLNKIKTDKTLRDTLKGADGESASATDVADTLKNDSAFLQAIKGEPGADGESASATEVADTLKNDSEFLQSVKGDKGEAGSGFSFKGNVSSTSDLPSCNTNTQSHAYYNTTDALLYICSCIDDTCEYNGVPFKGEKGDPGISAKSVQQQYCEENLDIVKALYSSVTQLSDCANATKFSYAQYNAIMGGARAYCLSLTQNPLDLTSGIGKKLVATFGSDKMIAFNSAPNAQSRVKLTGFTASSIKTNATFMEACEARYNEIMSGDDGEDAETAWHAYCEAQNEKDTSITNLDAIIKPLYGDNKTCDNFTSSEYNAIQGGARAYCLSLVQKFDALDLTTGIGQKLSNTFGTSKMQSLKNINTTKDRLSVKTFGTNSNQNFVTACEEKYNEIMSGTDGQNGQDGQDGRDGKSAIFAWCEAHIKGNPTLALSPAKMVRVFDTNIRNAGAITIDTKLGGGIFADMESCVSAITANPDLMGGESEADQEFNRQQLINVQTGNFDLSKATGDLVLHRTNFIKTLKGKDGTNGKNGEKGKDGSNGQSAADLWCDAHSRKNDNTVAMRLSPAKMTRAYAKIKDDPAFADKIEIGSTAGKGGYFTDMNACLAAVAADPDLMGGESAADQKFNELQTAEIQKGNFTLANATAALSAHRAGFIDTLKGAAGKDGTNGKTFKPVFDSTTGNLSWSEDSAYTGSVMKIAKTDSEINNLAINALKTELGGTSTSTLSSLIKSKAAEEALTMDDLVTYIHNGGLTIANGAITINTNITKPKPCITTGCLMPTK
ncbi:MAG: hypothetical protein MJ164_01400 [Alphaproteobacteria bacterium]|nr:hypothetical protein [Alphaproteobacteria bacterium]